MVSSLISCHDDVGELEYEVADGDGLGAEYLVKGVLRRARRTSTTDEWKGEKGAYAKLTQSVWVKEGALVADDIRPAM